MPNVRRIGRFMKPGIGERHVLAVLITMATTTMPAWCVHPCARCHPHEVAGFAATQMGRSLGQPGEEPSGQFVHAVSNSRFSIEWSGSRIVQRVDRDGLTAGYPIAYAIGSGTHARAYLIRLGDHLFQSPLGYFAGRGWGMSPGYENSKDPDFYRPVTPDCLVCHAGRARPVRWTFNTYQNPPFEEEAITCDRCHGPAEAHLRNPVPGSIINPARLASRARASVCEQCHLSGEERIPNPGKQLSDFRPGEELEEVYSVYVAAGSRDPRSANPLKVISQAQQLALSACARQSHGKLWCGTCHDPHEQPANPKTYFRTRCLTCHGTALGKSHPKPAPDCIGCHMPRRPVSDGAHTVFTDHRITRRPPEATAGASALAPLSLVAWRDPPGALAKRNLGLAEIRLGERLESFPLVKQGFQSLSDCLDDFPNDPAVLTGIGNALLVVGQGRDAAAAFEQAVQIEPHDALHYLHAGLAWKRAGENEKAIADLEKAVELDPLLEQPYLELARVYSGVQDSSGLRRTCERYLKAFPGSIKAQAMVRDIP